MFVTQICFETITEKLLIGPFEGIHSMPLALLSRLKSNAWTDIKHCMFGEIAVEIC